MRQADEFPPVRPWVAWTASRIQDPLWRLRYLHCVASPPARVSAWKSRKTLGLLAVIALGLVVAPWSLRMHGAAKDESSTLPPLPALPMPHFAPPDAPAPDVWLVEKTKQFETYSNGLRIDDQYAASNRPRSYVAFSLADPSGNSGEKRSRPAGIVYHTTESLQAPFESSQNSVLKRVGESLLDYVRRRRCYNFMIDRFGRVFRVVQESDASDHAGHSVWADNQYFYVNLNDSFLGVSFEAQTGAGGSAGAGGGGGIAGQAQLRAAAMLTEMLRSRYGIPAGNCVTHAQVSVNPSNMRVGYHTDWASSFPFEALGLPDNYATPSPAVYLFGFVSDAVFQQHAGGRMAGAAVEAERAVASQAAAAHLKPSVYRKALQKRFWKIQGHRG